MDMLSFGYMIFIVGVSIAGGYTVAVIFYNRARKRTYNTEGDPRDLRPITLATTMIILGALVMLGVYINILVV